MKRFFEVVVRFTKREWFLLVTLSVIALIFVLFESL